MIKDILYQGKKIPYSLDIKSINMGVMLGFLKERMVMLLGNEYNERGERQLSEYLDYFHQEKGYMVSFNFNKKKEVGVKKLRVEGKTIIEAVV